VSNLLWFIFVLPIEIQWPRLEASTESVPANQELPRRQRNGILWLSRPWLWVTDRWGPPYEGPLVSDTKSGKVRVRKLEDPAPSPA
jgi:hypothetical protein